MLTQIREYKQERLEGALNNHPFIREKYKNFLKSGGNVKIHAMFGNQANLLDDNKTIKIRLSLNLEEQLLSLLHELVHWEQGGLNYRDPYIRHSMEVEAYAVTIMYAKEQGWNYKLDGKPIGTCPTMCLSAYVQRFYL